MPGGWFFGRSTHCNNAYVPPNTKVLMARVLSLPQLESYIYRCGRYHTSGFVMLGLLRSKKHVAMTGSTGSIISKGASTPKASELPQSSA